MLNDPLEVRSLESSDKLKSNGDAGDPISFALVNLDAGRSSRSEVATGLVKKMSIGTVQSKEQVGTIVDRVQIRAESPTTDSEGKVWPTFVSIVFGIPRAVQSDAKAEAEILFGRLVRVLCFPSSNASGDAAYDASQLQRILNGEG